MKLLPAALKSTRPHLRHVITLARSVMSTFTEQQNTPAHSAASTAGCAFAVARQRHRHLRAWPSIEQLTNSSAQPTRLALLQLYGGALTASILSAERWRVRHHRRQRSYGREPGGEATILTRTSGGAPGPRVKAWVAPAASLCAGDAERTNPPALRRVKTPAPPAIASAGRHGCVCQWRIQAGDLSRKVRTLSTSRDWSDA